MVEGESGLLACLPPSEVADWNRSIGELYLTNGTKYALYTAEKPDRLRGPQHHRGWCDEIGAWKYAQDTWDMYQMGLRLGDHPQTVITSTPRPIKLLRDLIADDGTIVSSGSTYENKDNLPESFIRTILRKYEGTRLGRQELYAELLADIPGALWQRTQIDQLRWMGVDPLAVAKMCRRIVVAIDPAVTSTEDADETGISVVGIMDNDIGVVLADGSVRESPNNWAKAAIRLYRTFGADRIIGETNNGGDLVEEVLRSVDKTVPFSKVTASRGKYVRAEPISSLYEQGRVRHVGTFDTLEDQMCMFTPDNIAKQSPDRVEALVWGFTELFDGCMNLGVLEHAKSVMTARNNLVKPATIQMQPSCPSCKSIAISTVGRGKRCNQCGKVFDQPEHRVGMIPTRNNLSKFLGRG